MSDEQAGVLRALVADGRSFGRSLVAEALRTYGPVDINYANSADDCLEALSIINPGLLILDWAIDGGRGASVMRRIRNGEAGEAQRMVPVVLTAGSVTLSDLHRARACGADEFVLRPFSSATLVAHVRELLNRRRERVATADYDGPDRRRQDDPDYQGPHRRMFDSEAAEADDPHVHIRKGLARMYVERIAAMQLGAKPGDPDARRELSLTCAQLSALAADLAEPLLASATASLSNYIKGVSVEAALNVDVVKAHLDTILQLADLPNSQNELRRTVTQQLSLMVSKKLRGAGKAA